MRLHAIRHVSFEGPGSLEPWAQERSHSLTQSDQSLGQPLPSLDSFDALILMGGPMSVNDEDVFAWLRPEKELVRQALAAGKKILGICLGAQMIASALGQKVYPNAHKEIGWFPLELTALGRVHPFAQGLPGVLNAFHWHGETFDLPAGATKLFRTAACENQAYAIGRQVLALQCHVEVTLGSMEAMVVNGRDELDLTKPFIQSETVIMGQAEKLGLVQPLAFKLFDQWIIAA